jgi:trehalose/maltose hydrolase-like predicted phosphorylase
MSSYRHPDARAREGASEHGGPVRNRTGRNAEQDGPTTDAGPDGTPRRSGPCEGQRWVPMVLGRTFGAVVLDWDGTVVPDRHHDASAARRYIESLTQVGIHVAVVSGTHLDNVDGQLGARPSGPGTLHLALNRGSELFEVTRSGPQLVGRREETPAEHSALDHVAGQVVAELHTRGLPARLVGDRPNRRKIDLLPDAAWSDPPKARIWETLRASHERLARAGFDSLASVADLCGERWASTGLDPLCVTTDAKHIELGLTDKADSLRTLLGVLDRYGVGPGLVLVVGDEFGALDGLPGSDSRMILPGAPGIAYVSVGVEPEGVPHQVLPLGGGPRTVALLFDEQLGRSLGGRVPDIDTDPAWTWVETADDPARRRVAESLQSLTSGRFCTRGVGEGPPDDSAPAVRASGLYAGRGADHGLMPGPDWTDVLREMPDGGSVRTLDLRTGVLLRQRHLASGRTECALRFAVADQPGVVALRVETDPERLAARAGTTWHTIAAGDGGIGALVRTRTSASAGLATCERLGALVTATDPPPPRSEAQVLLGPVAHSGFGGLLCRHRAAWARRWKMAGIDLPSDPELQRALRFALFHLWSLAGPGAELAVGARGATGPAYTGHVFWDADVFVLPAAMTLDPGISSAMVAYRLARLDAAREEARAVGLAGARYPWESALTGHDVTPHSGSIGGQQVPIRTGALEDHITADVAWSVVRNATWCRPGGWLSRSERILLAETARYWADRACRDTNGRWHVDHVIGPDEYHEDVDDNAYTNVMARWNLRTAAARCAAVSDPDERRGWMRVADGLVDGYDAVTGCHEQFRGYLGLEHIGPGELGRTPVAADVLLGRDHIAASQVIKQPDVLMLHHVVPGEVPARSLAADVELYTPHTSHGSSLSLATTASVLARAGRADEALAVLRLAASIDLDDIGGTTAAGLHLASLGGSWQALVFGFLGAEVVGGHTLRLDPRLPAAWDDLTVRFRCLGERVTIDVRGEEVTVATSGPLLVGSRAGRPVRTAPGETRTWKVGRHG